MKSISTNWYQTLVLTHSNKLFMCGSNIGTTFRELIIPDAKIITKISSFYHNFMALTDDHKVYKGQQCLRPAVFEDLIPQESIGLVPIDISESYCEGYVLFGCPTSSKDLQEQSKRILQIREKGSFVDVIIHHL